MRSKVVLFQTYSTEKPTVVSVGGLAPFRNSRTTCRTQTIQLSFKSQTYALGSLAWSVDEKAFHSVCTAVEAVPSTDKAGLAFSCMWTVDPPLQKPRPA